MLGRIIRVEDHVVHIGTETEVLARPTGGATFGLGDLVRVSETSVELVTRNRSERDIEKQDWWRLLQVLPRVRARAKLLADVRGWFRERDFLEVETPISTATPCPEVHLHPPEVRLCGRRRWLNTSPELHMKRLLSCGVERILYTGRAFRDDERGHHHSPEFTMLEWYRADEEPEALMQDVKQLVALATGTVRAWTTVTVAEALMRWGNPRQARTPEEVVRQLVDCVEPALVDLGCVFLTEFPAEMASLARVRSENKRIAERFEVYVDGVELANAFGELTCPDQQRARFAHDLEVRQATGKPLLPMPEDFLDALAAGLPPVSGIAMGFDRLAMLAVGADSIDEVSVFPFEIA